MKLTDEEKDMLAGKQGHAVRQSMEILVALGTIFGARRLIPVSHVQVAGVSYDNLGDAGLDYLAELAKDGRVKVPTTLNPAGMDLENWEALGISADFAAKQKAVIEAFARMNVITSCTCTPYLIGYRPKEGEHVAWSESSAVAYANSVLGARTNREGGPSALAAALTGRTPEYGLHLEESRGPKVAVEVACPLSGTERYGALGKAMGEKIGNKIALIRGVREASVEELKSFCASVATYGGTALFYIEGITPKPPAGAPAPSEKISISSADVASALASMNDGDGMPDFVSLGCPHLTLGELGEIAGWIGGRKAKVECWLCVSREVKRQADAKGWSRTIEAAGIRFACDTCMVVAPVKGRWKCMATDSAKSCYYARAKNKFRVRVGTPRQCIEYALGGRWE